MVLKGGVLTKTGKVNRRSVFIHRDNQLLKRCTVCKQVRPLAEFNKNKSTPSGLEYFCKNCNVLRFRSYYKNNPDKCRAIANKSMHKHKDRMQARSIANHYYPIAKTCSIINCNDLGERHHEDYAKPKTIVWLCRKHHAGLCKNT